MHDHIPVTAMVKLEYIPVSVDTDFLIIGNIPALIEECLAIKYSRMDDPRSLELSAAHHAKAIKLLQQEMVHYEGRVQPAVQFSPFGTATTHRALAAVRRG